MFCSIGRSNETRNSTLLNSKGAIETDALNSSKTSANIENEQSGIGCFRYYFPNALIRARSSSTIEHLSDLAAEMTSKNHTTSAENSNIPAIFAPLGQFITHDISACETLDLPIWDGANEKLELVSRSSIQEKISNLRTGTLSLENIYGNERIQDENIQFLSTLLRDPENPAKLRIGKFLDTVVGRVPYPEDQMGDLPRLGSITNIENPDSSITDQELLRSKLPNTFFDNDGQPNIQKALIAEPRNDENLLTAQLHMAFLRFHNRIVDGCNDKIFTGSKDDDDAVFNWARQQTKWHYQWLVVNEYLPKICCKSVVSKIQAAEAPLYSFFLKNHANRSTNPLPVPIEFSHAAALFSHSMVRGKYDWNQYFGRPIDEDGDQTIRADLESLYAHTGASANSMPNYDEQSHIRLPSHWAPAWNRLTDCNNKHKHRSSAAINTRIRDTHVQRTGQSSQTPICDYSLAQHILFTDYFLKIPSAQDCIAGIVAKTGAAIPPLTSNELLSGHTRSAVKRGNFDTATPLWFYLLKEAEITSDGNYLGPLGSHIVADTIIGLIINDPNSYWNQPGADNGRWHPDDGSQPANEPVTSIKAFLRAAQLL